VPRPGPDRVLPAPRGDKQDLEDILDTQFLKPLQEAPNGEVLSRSGVMMAAERAARFFLVELDRVQQSAMSSTVNHALKDAARSSERASKMMQKAYADLLHLKELDLDLSGSVLARIEAVPTTILRLVDEMVRPNGGLPLLSQPFEDALEMIEKTGCTELDRTYLQGEVRQFFDFRGAFIHPELLSLKAIQRLEALSVVFNAAATLKGIANPSGGSKRIYHEFRMPPACLLVRECQAILSALNLSYGLSKGGILEELASGIRQFAEGGSAKGITGAIDDLPKAATMSDPPPEEWIRYRRLCLLIDDLKQLSHLGRGLKKKLETLEERRDAQWEWMNENLILKPHKTGTATSFIQKKGNRRNLDEASPFG